jgi:mycofactocin precursor
MEVKKELEFDLKAKQEEIREELADILEEIEIEDLTVDGICGVY